MIYAFRFAAQAIRQLAGGRLALLKKLFLLAVMLGGLNVLRGADPFNRGPVIVSERASEIHKRSFVFDGHNDLPWEIRTKGSRNFQALDISRPQPKLHTDIARCKLGGLGAQYWSVYVPSDTAYDGSAHQKTLEQIEIVQAMIARYPETFAAARTYRDVMDARAAGKIASLIGVEGGHAIDNSIEKLRRLHKLGAGYMTLTHSDSLDWADSCTDKAKASGLNEFGKEVVREMNRLGMLVDISHVSPETMQAALDVSVSPIIFSHSSARAIADHPRNVPDEILKQLPKNGGIVMVNFYSGFVVPSAAATSRRLQPQYRELKEKFRDSPDQYKIATGRLEAQNPLDAGSVHDVADHIDHIVKVAGINHVGIGSDYDGISKVPKQLEDVSTYPVLTQVLMDRGYNEADIHKIMSGNMLRVMQAAESIAASLSPNSTGAGEDLVLNSSSTSCRLVFASAEEAKSALTSRDDFVAALSPFDRASRLKTDQPVDEAAYLQFVGKQAMAWTDEERDRLSQAIGSVRSVLEKMDLPFPKKILLVKTSGLEEGAAAYTRGAAIFFPQGKLAGQRGLAKLFCHELFHVLSRHDQKWRDRLYEVIGFRRCPELKWPDELASIKLTNPDAPTSDHCIEIEVDSQPLWTIPILYSRSSRYDPSQGGEFFQYMVFRLIVVDPPSKSSNPAAVTGPVLKEGKSILLDPKKVTGYLEKIGRNTGYIIHPDETLADNFALIVDGKSDVPSPEILTKIKTALSQ